MAWRGIIEQYRSFLPVTPKTPVVTLGEGNTPLVRAPRLADAIQALYGDTPIIGDPDRLDFELAGHGA